MKYLAVILLVVALQLYGGEIELVQYSDLRLRDSTSSNSSLYGDWKLVKGDNEESISFDMNKISGFDGCNRYSAQLAIAGEKLKIGAIMATRAYCEGIQGTDEKFTHKLALIVSYEIDEDGYLILYDHDCSLLLKLHR